MLGIENVVWFWLSLGVWLENSDVGCKLKMNPTMKKKMNLSKRGNGSGSGGVDVDIDDKDGVDLVSNAVHCVDKMCKQERMGAMKQGWLMYLVVRARRNKILVKTE